MLTKKLIVSKVVTRRMAGVCVKQSTVGRKALLLCIFFFFPFSILGRNIPGKVDRNAFSFPNNS